MNKITTVKAGTIFMENSGELVKYETLK